MDKTSLLKFSTVMGMVTGILYLSCVLNSHSYVLLGLTVGTGITFTGGIYLAGERSFRDISMIATQLALTTFFATIALVAQDTLDDKTFTWILGGGALAFLLAAYIKTTSEIIRFSSVNN